MLLEIDAGPNTEVVAVKTVAGNNFTADFTMPHGAGVLRIQVNANHTMDSIQGLLGALNALKSKMNGDGFADGTESDLVTKVA